MARWWAPLGALVVVALLAGAVLVLALQKPAAPIVLGGVSATPGVLASGVIAHGEGTLTLAPDTAFVGAGVDSQAATAAEAQADLAGKAAAVVVAAKKAGVQDPDISTAGYSVGPEYSPPSYTQVLDYRASEQLAIKWHDPKTVGKLLDALGASGATRVSASFGLGDPSAAEAQARALAVKDAHARAQAMAEAAGVSLGAVVRVSDLSAPIYYAPNAEASGAKGGTQLPVGTVQVSASVEVDYAIG